MYIHGIMQLLKGLTSIYLPIPFIKQLSLQKITGNFSDYEENTKETHTDFCFSFYFNNEFMCHDIFW